MAMIKNFRLFHKLEPPYSVILENRNNADTLMFESNALAVLCMCVKWLYVNEMEIIAWHSHTHSHKINLITTFDITAEYCSRTNCRHLLLVFVRLFLCHSVHPFKYLVILNVTLRPILRMYIVGRGGFFYRRPGTAADHLKTTADHLKASQNAFYM